MHHDHADEQPAAASVAAEYASVPLFMVNTSGLEAYLTNLSRQLGRDMGSVKEELACTTRDSRYAKKTVNDVKRLLTLSAKEKLSALLDENSPAEQEETEALFRKMFPPGEAESEGDLLAGLLTVAKKLACDNTRLRVALDENTRVTKDFVKQQGQLHRQLSEADYRLKRHQSEFHELSRWLGVYDAEADRMRSLTAGDGGVAEVAAQPKGDTRLASCEPTAFSDSEVESAVSQSPLLLAFRRILLRDMVDRVAHTSELQARELGGVVSSLKEDLRQRATADNVTALMESRLSSNVQTLADGLAKRLKEVEDAYVTHDELRTAMKSKADTMLMPVKADSAVVTTLERRVFDKYAELEERVAYFEAEREEFRSIVRSLIAQQQQQQMMMHPTTMTSAALPAGQSPDSGGGFSFITEHDRSGNSGARDARAVAAQPVRLDEVMPFSATYPRSGDAADHRTAEASPARATNMDVGGKTIFRVIGANRKAFATSASAATAMEPEAGARGGPSHGMTQGGNSVGLQSSLSLNGSRAATTGRTVTTTTAPAAAGEGGRRDFIGLTAHQAAHTHNSVAGELSRADVERLPALPYQSKG